METKVATTRKIKVMDGNKAAANGVLLCQPDVVAAFPITPQTPLIEAIWKFVANGQLKAEAVEVEGELSAISVLIGASAAGGRTFTATSSQGLAFMYEAYFRAAGSRLPIVMVVATRELAAPDIVAGGQQDVMSVRDAGWMQIHCETCQEILDTIIMSYRIAEDSEILLPILVCYDGYYLSHLSERVEIPFQEEVDEFLAPLKAMAKDRPRLSLDHPLTFSAFATGPVFSEYRYKHTAAMTRAKKKIDDVDGEFKKILGRSWGGVIEEYRCEDAEVVLVAVGSAAGSVRTVVNKKREEGVKVGLIKLRSIRPFPRERLVNAIRDKKAVGIIDRNVCVGWNSGTMFMEMKALQADLETRIPMASFIDGLAGTDITLEHIERALEITQKAARGEAFQEVTWLGLEAFSI